MSESTSKGWTTSTTTTYTSSSYDSVPVRTLSVRRNAQAINVLVSHKTPKQYPEMMLQLTYVARHLKQTVGSYSCLEVGAREGRLLQCWPTQAALPSEYVGLERNPKYNDLLRQSMKDKQLKGSIIHSRRPPNEIENLTGREPFDLIIFSHSLYWTSEHAAQIVHESIQHLLHKDHGICLIFHHAFGFYSLWHLMERQFTRDQPLQVQPHSAGSSAVQLIAAFQLLQQQQQKQQQQNENGEEPRYTPMVAAIDPCPLYLNGLNDHQWDELLSWIFQLEAAELPDSIRHEAIQLVLGSATQTSESTNALSSSSHHHHQNSAHTRTSTQSADSTNSCSSSHYKTIDGTQSTTQRLLLQDTHHEYWLHHPHVTIKITKQQQYDQE